MEFVREVLGTGIYAAQALVALWGAFCVIVVWRRVSAARFRSEEAQESFLAELQPSVAAGDFQGAADLCEGDGRALPQLSLLAIDNRGLGFDKVKHLVADRFQRDVLSDLEYRLSWVNTVIKSAPMLGLFGTVGGMMGAFDTLGSGSKIDPANLASDISVALVTTVIGLAIAIPLMLVVAAINIRIRKLEDLVGAGLIEFFEVYKPAVEKYVRGT
jgi:biopolymer transport protein ExbB/TolQ